MEEMSLISPSKLILLSGPSGAGKSTMLNILTNKYDIEPLVYYTTRAKRNDDNKNIFNYLTLEEYNKIYRNGKFILSFGSHINRYGVLYSEFEEKIRLRKNIILIVSYNDFLEILRRGMNELISINLVVLSFIDFNNIKIRLKERDLNIDDKYLKMKIDYANYEHQKYFDIIKQYADCVIYTDNETIDDTETIIYNSVLKYNNIVLRRKK